MAETKKPPEPKEPKKQTHCSKAGLKYRGWTEKAIALFLGEPDKTAVNPHYKCAAPVKLYLLTRIEEAEKSEVYQRFVKESDNRKEGSKKALETKKAQPLEYVQRCQILIWREHYEKILADALREYNSFQENVAYKQGRNKYKPITINSHSSLLDRILVDYLRNLFSPFERELENRFGKIVSINKARKALDKKIYGEISRAYPELKDECVRQFTRTYHETLPVYAS